VFDKIFDRAKDIAIVAVLAGLLALIAASMLAVSAAWTLSQWMVWPAALAVTAVGILAIAAIALWFGMAEKKKKPEPEPDPMTDVDPVTMVLGLMELPVEVVKKIVMEKPIASIAVIASVGLLISRKPEVALKLFDKVVGGLGKLD
jgi:dipeptide/tripeptide permease